MVQEGHAQHIARNTIMLYIRTLAIMFISLYTSRVVLQTLGVIDYGVYNVVGGFVTMFALINSSLSAAVSRFLTFELGKKDVKQTKITFSTSITIHLVMAVIIFLLMETFGLWFLNTQLSIPDERMTAANWVFQFSVITFMVNLISVPYNAAIIAHEHMKTFAYIGILEAALKLVVVGVLVLVDFDKMVLFGILMLLVSILIRYIYNYYCTRHFEECHYKFIFDKKTFKAMLGFAGWNFIGSSSSILRGEGSNILLNIFFGPAVNAARNVSFQVNNAISGFMWNFMTAISPQITKSYAAGNREYLMKLIFMGAKMAYFLMMFFTLPVLFETNFVLDFWLDEVPKHSVEFVQIILVFSMIGSISRPLVDVQNATGKIRNYQIIVGGLQLMNLPSSYLVLKLGAPPESVLLLFSFWEIACLTARLILLRKTVQLDSWRFIKQVILRALLTTSLAMLLPFYVVQEMSEGWLRFIVVGIVAVVSSLFFIYYIGLIAEERVFLLQLIHNKRKKK